jgi:hypothetical protein
MSIYQYPIKGIKIINPKKKPSETDVIIGYELIEIQDHNPFTGCLYLHKQYQQPVYENLENLFKNLNTQSISIIPKNLSPIYEEVCVYV